MAQQEVVVVTGAAAGVGRATAHRFARPGVRLALIARDAEALKTVKHEVESRGAEASVHAVDVADAEALFAATREIDEAWGGIDIWVNDAMATVFSPFVEITPEEFRRVTEVTYLGFVHGTMAALKVMQPRGRGSIVQVGSALAYRGIPLQSAYCGAKHAIRGFTDSVRTELLHEGSKVRLSVVDLPAVNTPQFDWARTHLQKQPRPMGKVYEPEAAAEAIWTAAHGNWREYWLGRTTLMTILGNTILPGWMDRYLSKAWEGQETSEDVSPQRADNLYQPVTDLHRTRGSFEKGAQRRALLLPGPAARLGTVIAGALACIGAGYALGRVARG